MDNANYTVTKYILVTCIFLITACQTTSIRHAIENTNKGVVAVKVVNTTSFKFPINKITIVEKNTFSGSKPLKPITFSLTEKVNNDSYFVEAIPVGTYIISQVHFDYLINGSEFSKTFEVGIELGTFTVTAGAVTDLGKLIYYHILEEENIFGSLTRPSTSSLIKDFKNHPSIPPELINLPSSSWDGRPSLEVEHKYSSSIQNPLVFLTSYQTPDNYLYLPGKSGVITYRSPNGKWKILPTLYEEDLFSIIKLDNDRLLVGSNNGLIQDFKSGKWTEFRLENDYTIVDFIQVSSQRIAVLAKSNTNIQVAELDISSTLPVVTGILTYAVSTGWSNHFGEQLNIGHITYSDPTLAFSQSSRPEITAFFAGNNSNVGLIVNVSGTAINSTDYYSISLKNNSVISRHTYDENFSKLYKWNNNIYGFKNLDIEFLIEGVGIYTIFNPLSNSWTEFSSKYNICGDVNLSRISTCEFRGQSMLALTNGFQVNPPLLFKSETVVGIHTSEYNKRPFYPDIDLTMFTRKKKEEEYFKGYADQPVSDKCFGLSATINETLVLYCKGVTADIYESTDLGNTWTRVREHHN